jgi:hypothetical protein
LDVRALEDKEKIKVRGIVIMSEPGKPSDYPPLKKLMQPIQPGDTVYITATKRNGETFERCKEEGQQAQRQVST